jgi:hypothetical protein
MPARRPRLVATGRGDGAEATLVSRDIVVRLLGDLQ